MVSGLMARVDDVYNDKSTLKTVPFVVHTSDGKNLPPDVQTNQQNIKEQKPEIHHLSTLPTRDNFVHCNHKTYCHLQDNGCYESTPGEFKTTKLWKTYGLFTPLSSSVLYWIQTYLCLWSISLRWRMRACGDVRRALL